MLNGRSDMNDQAVLSDRETTGDEPVAPPTSERVISDVESLKAISDPMRLRILETMVTEADQAWTVKRLAAAMGVGPTKLYHHVNILEEREFIRVAGTRVVSGIIETSYQIAQLTVRLDRALLSGSDPDAESSVHDVIGAIFDSVRDEIEQGLRSGPIREDDDPLANLMIRGLTKIPADRAVEMKRRLRELFAEFDTDDPSEVEPGSLPFGCLVAVYPYPEPKTTYPEASDD
jgi:DNA-binding transcriptional ArsR family regulator